MQVERNSEESSTTMHHVCELYKNSQVWKLHNIHHKRAVRGNYCIIDLLHRHYIHLSGVRAVFSYCGLLLLEDS